jgi:hypothetical protein
METKVFSQKQDLSNFLFRSKWTILHIKSAISYSDGIID